MRKYLKVYLIILFTCLFSNKITYSEEKKFIIPAIKLIKKYILDLKESNIEKLIIVGLVQKFLQNSVLSLTTEQIIEML